MKITQRLLALPLLLATALMVACEGAGPVGPMMDMDTHLMGAQAKGGKSGAETALERALDLVLREQTKGQLQRMVRVLESGLRPRVKLFHTQAWLPPMPHRWSVSVRTTFLPFASGGLLR